MTTPTNGGPAFPSQPKDAQGNPMGPLEPGMSLRDWFAGQAIAGLCSRTAFCRHSLEDQVKISFEVADAMIARRNPQ